ncbi:DUF2905 domain-containing protein [Pseudothermotoga sp.]|nr:DUF2905 domain-containing protein [Pseudothermotoga sp.]MCX7813754.1 DUF2905 domain-containing protein [Pseudothermotoga sp.]MDW8140452.1 DUF2905 domain-containing protein [Pseudothermotoga sp.]
MVVLARFLIFIGVVLLVTGLVLYVIGRFTPLGKLPGDIVIKREKFVFYFPIMTSLLLSLVLTVLFFIISRFGR